MKQSQFARVPAADWRTENLHDIWGKTNQGKFIAAEGSLHAFLQYCGILRDVRLQFESDDTACAFDGFAFFLRGGYFAFAYLNRTTSMALRATIFGGMNHGRHPKMELPVFIRELQDKVLSSGRRRVELFIVDEVKSGTGMGTILNLIKNAISSRASANQCDVRVSFYAVRPGSTNDMTSALRSAVKKWNGRHVTRSGQLLVDIKHFSGPLFGYDDPLLCGIKTVSCSMDPQEAYELVKLNGGSLTLRCDVTGHPVFQADIGENCLVEFLSSCAVKWTCERSSVLTETLARTIDCHGCDTCRQLLASALR